MREVPLADDSEVSWPGATFEETDQETKTVDLFGFGDGGEAAGQDAPHYFAGWESD